MPCVDCARFMRELGVKTVYYTTGIEDIDKRLIKVSVIDLVPSDENVALTFLGKRSAYVSRKTS